MSRAIVVSIGAEHAGTFEVTAECPAEITRAIVFGSVAAAIPRDLGTVLVATHRAYCTSCRAWQRHGKGGAL